MRDLWLRLDLSEARGKVHWTSVRAYIRRSKGMLTHAVVKNISSPSTQKVLEFITRCPHLGHFEFRDAYNNVQAFHDHLVHSTHLKRLKTLVVSRDTPLPQHMITQLLSKFPLERLEVHAARPSRQEIKWPLALPSLKSITLCSDEPPPNAAFTPALHIPALEVRSAHNKHHN